jgi:hypothetical protein
MRTLDAIDHIRSNPEMYLPGGKPDASALAKRLAGDALLLGATVVGYGSSNGWWFVAADKDWLRNSAAGTEDAFTRIIPFPEAGPNAVRTEVLLYAFAKEIVAIVQARWEALKGGKGALRSARDAIDEPSIVAGQWLSRAWPPAHERLVVAFRIPSKRETSRPDLLRPGSP